MKLPWPFSKSRPTIAATVVPQSKRPRRIRHGFDGATTGTLYSRWLTLDQKLDLELRSSLPALRARARDLMKNDDYCRRYMNLLLQNVVGLGVQLQARISDSNGKLDTANNRMIEDAWWKFTRKGRTSADGKLSFHDVERLVLKGAGTDGEIFIRKHVVNSEFRLEVIPADAVDVRYEADLGKGRRVVMGVELDDFNRPLAYHVVTRPQSSGEQRVRIPANEVIHVVDPEFADQTRGFPWIVSGMRTLHVLKLYREAELIAADVAAGKMGFFTSRTGEEFSAIAVDREEEDGPLITNADPGTFHELPEGMQFSTFDPQHPNSSYAPFVQEVLRGIASGFGISYAALANDPTAMSWSALRHVELQDRDFYRTKQAWLIESLHVPVFEAWLEHAMLSGALDGKTIPPSAFDKLNNVQFMPRSWAWVDPLKDIEANREMVRMNVKSLTAVAAEQGSDLEEVIKQRVKERALLDAAGLPDGLDSRVSPAQADDEGGQPVNGRPTEK